MKRIIITMCALFLLAGCASNRSGSTEYTKSNTPKWWFNPATSETHYYAFGQATNKTRRWHKKLPRKEPEQKSPARSKQ